MPRRKKTVTDDPWLTPSEIAQLVHVSHDVVLSWINGGELRAVDVSTRPEVRHNWRVRKSDLDLLLEQRGSQ